MKEILKSQYRIIKFIGKGGFGKTYLAEDLLLPSGNNTCVVKQLYPAIDNEAFLATARRLFTKEAQTLQKVGTHNQIPRLLAYFEEDNQFYLVQQYIEGHTLGKELSSGKIWTESQVIALLKDGLNILDFIHSQGVIHRDVKPDNLIRRSQDGKLVLVDFGTVKEVIIAQTQMIHSTVAIGTRGYMPTEQAKGKPRFTSDIYALGAIAIQALTGIHPIHFQENDEGEIVWQSQTPLNKKLAAIISQMVRYHFKDRYQSAREILVALDRIPTSAPKTSLFKFGNKSTKSKIYTPTMQVNSAQFSELAATTPQEIKSATSNQNSQNFSTNHVSAQSSSLLPDNSSSRNLSSSSISSAEKRSPDNSSQVNSLVQPNSQPQRANWLKSPVLITTATAIFIGVAAMGGMHLLNQQNEQKLSKNRTDNLQLLDSLNREQKYSECYEMVTASDSNSTFNSLTPNEKVNWQAQCGLGMATQKAETLDFTGALAIAIQLPQKIENQETASQIKTSIEQWSNETLEKATSLYEKEGKLKEALEQIQTIPQNTTAKTKASTLLATWKQENAANQKILAQSQKYLAQKLWQNAVTEASKLTNSSTDYWQQQGRDLVSQAQAEIQAQIDTKSQQPEIEQSNLKEKEPEVRTETNQKTSQEKEAFKEPETLRDLGNNPSNNAQKNPIPEPNNEPLRDL
jgi:serine/threonine protein kinase, bacterial